MLEGDGSTAFDGPNFGRYGSSTFYCATGNVDADGNPIAELTSRGSEGRAPWTYYFDAGVVYRPSFAEGNLTLKLDVFNLFNFGKAIEFSETKDFARNDETISKNFLAPTAYQTPRSMRFTARYAF